MKSGMTMVSIVIYVTIFFTLSVFVISMSTNMNTKAMSEKGEIIVNEDIQKIQYNLMKSAKQSDRIDLIENKIVFSNNDEYYFDDTKKILYKNNGILSKNIQNFSMVMTDEIVGIDANQISNLDSNIKNVTFKIEAKKYDRVKSSVVFLALGVGLYE